MTDPRLTDQADPALAAEAPPAQLVVQPPQFLTPTADLTVVRKAYEDFVAFVRDILKEGVDYGAAREGGKPSLLKPGAEKLLRWFGLTPTFDCQEHAIDWKEGFFFWWYRCRVWQADRMIAEADGLCNSLESKYRYRWVPEHSLGLYGLSKDSKLFTSGGAVSEFAFTVERAETSGRYGKPAEYWQRFRDAIANGTAKRVEKQMRSGKTDLAWEIDQTLYRVPNPDIADQANTILKVSQKRALVASVLIACNASEFFTQDIEDLDFGVDENVTRKTAERPPVETKAAQPETKPAKPETPSGKGSAEEFRQWQGRQPAEPAQPGSLPPRETQSSAPQRPADAVSVYEQLSAHDLDEVFANLQVARGWNRARSEDFIRRYTGTARQLIDITGGWRVDAEQKGRK